MAITTPYGSWLNYTGSEDSLGGSVVTALTDYADEYDLDALTTEYSDAINAALPDGVALSGNDFLGPYYEADQHFDGYPVTEDGDLDIKAIIESVDFWEIAARHEQWTAEQVAEEFGYTGKAAAGTARKAMSRLGVESSLRRHPDSGRPQAVYPAHAVRAARAGMPGQGVRTDRTT